MSNGLNQEPEAAEAQEADTTDTAGRLARTGRCKGSRQVQQGVPIGLVRLLEGRTTLEVAGDGDRPEGGDGKGQPEAGGTLRMVHTGVLPLPGAALVALEALFTPAAQAIPGGRAGGGRQVGEYEPRFLILFAPPGQQGTVNAAALLFETAAAPVPLLPRLTPSGVQQIQQPVPVVLLAPRLELGRAVDAQKRMPLQPLDLLIEPAARQPAVRQDNDRPVRRHRRLQQTQQPPKLIPPGTFGVGGLDCPGHRDADAAVHHAHHQHHKAIP